MVVHLEKEQEGKIETSEKKLWKIMRMFKWKFGCPYILKYLSVAWSDI